jgi:hypothetical protein
MKCACCRFGLIATADDDCPGRAHVCNDHCADTIHVCNTCAAAIERDPAHTCRRRGTHVYMKPVSLEAVLVGLEAAVTARRAACTPANRAASTASSAALA